MPAPAAEAGGAGWGLRSPGPPVRPVPAAPGHSELHICVPSSLSPCVTLRLVTGRQGATGCSGSGTPSLSTRGASAVCQAALGGRRELASTGQGPSTVAAGPQLRRALSEVAGRKCLLTLGGPCICRVRHHRRPVDPFQGFSWPSTGRTLLPRPSVLQASGQEWTMAVPRGSGSLRWSWTPHPRLRLQPAALGADRGHRPEGTVLSRCLARGSHVTSRPLWP